VEAQLSLAWWFAEFPLPRWGIVLQVLAMPDVFLQRGGDQILFRPVLAKFHRFFDGPIGFRVNSHGI
jgi:hypothetical protein